MDLKKTKDRIVMFIIGIFILTLGASLTIKANLGAGSWDSANVGLSNLIGLSVGTFSFIIAIIMTIIAGILRHGKFNFYTLGTAFIISCCTDFWLFIIDKVPFNNIGQRFIYFILGIFILSLGLAIYLIPNLAPNSLDDCMLAFKERFNLSVGVSKLITDCLGIVIALLVSGPIGLGTIIITFSVGPLVGIFYSKFSSKIKILA